jgi:uncharacterized membrane protein YesL
VGNSLDFLAIRKYMIFSILKDSFIDFKDESIYLVTFNILSLISALPGWYLIILSLRGNLLIPFLLGLIVCLPLALTWFGLFHTANDISQAKKISFITFFRYIRQTWRPALVWGFVNLCIIAFALFNFRFYVSIEAEWAVILQLFFLGLLAIWLILQLMMLALYPRLKTSKYWSILPQAGALLSRYPGVIFVMVVLVAVIIGLSARFPFIVLFLTFCTITVLTNRFVEAVFKRELEKHPPR